MQLIQAKLNQFSDVTNLMQRTIEALDAQGIFQWNDQYPNRAFILEAIKDGNLYVLVSDETIIGSVVLDEWQAPEWNTIPWHQLNSPALVIHALAIDPPLQGQGYGLVLLHACEQLAREHGYGCLRLDVYEANQVARGLYEHSGYLYRGKIQFSSKPAGHQSYVCYEKILA